MKTDKSIELSSNNLNQDLRLFYKISDGHYAALEELFNKYYHPLCRFGLGYEQNIAIVEEKISDVFILLWNKRKDLKKITHPKSYIYVIAKNSLKKKLKINLPHQSLDDDNSRQKLPSSPSTEQNLIDQEEKEITAHLIQSILNTIPKKSRRIFELSRIDGFKYKEISEIEGLSARTVENHIALAMKYINKGLMGLNQTHNN